MSKKPKTRIPDDLPEEIILQILYKLPTKSLIRFTCVSKSWLSLIKNPTFISTYRNLSISYSKKNPLLLIHQPSYQNGKTDIEHYSLYFDNQEYDFYKDFCSPFKYHIPHFKVVGTINGLICVYDNISFGCCAVSLWNPSIKKYVTLPEPSVKNYTISLGFGFDSRSNDYKVLRVGSPLIHEDEGEEQKHEKGGFEFELYSFNTNSWKTICEPRYNITFFGGHVFDNGVMHLLVSKNVRDDKYQSFILGFDVGDEKFKEITLPEGLANWTRLFLNVLVYKESVAVFQRNPHVPTWSHLWVMKEYGVVDSWTKIFTFNGPEGGTPWPLRFSHNGELFLRVNGGMASCSLESREIKRLRFHIDSSFVDYFVESMELLDNANASSDPTVENDAIGDAASDATGGNV